MFYFAAMKQMQAVVYKSTGSWYLVRTEDGKMHPARIRGHFKMEGISSTNPIAVGDEVLVEIEDLPETTVTISDILPRKNYVIRQSPHSKRQHHIIAANLDQSMVFITLREPRTSQGFVDRFLVSCEAFHVPAILVFNKVDVYRAKEMYQLEDWKAMYTEIGYQVLVTSTVTEEGLDDLKAALVHKKTLLSGHSGVGKSSLMNVLFPELELRTAAVSEWSGKGMHTTTFAEMHDLPNGGCVIDTPGVREFGIVGIEPEELSHYFPEMKDRINDCQFNNCQHLHEPGCAIKAAIESGEIAMQRFESYLNIHASMEKPGY